MSKYCKMNDEQKAKRSEYMRKWRTEHPEYMHKYRADHREEWREHTRKQHYQDLNSQGIRKHYIRNRSNKYLFYNHSKLKGYEIHHCFGYEDYRKFIYIPKELHILIHKLLRTRKIPSDSDHWMFIRDLVNSCDQYTYISG